MKKNVRSLYVILIRHKHVTIKHTGKLFNLFFSEKEKITNKITLTDEDETVISDAQLISEELNIFLKTPPKL